MTQDIPGISFNTGHWNRASDCLQVRVRGSDGARQARTPSWTRTVTRAPAATAAARVATGLWAGGRPGARAIRTSPCSLAGVSDSQPGPRPGLRVGARAATVRVPVTGPGSPGWGSAWADCHGDSRRVLLGGPQAGSPGPGRVSERSAGPGQGDH
jgi:hypothetical protein